MPEPFCEALDDALLRRYLLDRADEEERDQVERYLFEDTAGLERIKAATVDLLDEAARGNVPFDQLERALAYLARETLPEPGSQQELPFYGQIAAGRPYRPGEVHPSERGLTPADFQALLARLSPDREQAGALYVDIRRRLVWFFDWRLGGDAESLADEAIDRVARRLAEGNTLYTERPFGYFYGVARHVAQEILRQREREVRALGALEADDAVDRPEPIPEVDPRLACLQRCLGQLPADRRRLLLRYHAEADRVSSRRRLAQGLGIEVNALRIRAHRARCKLEDCCARCLAES